MLEKMSQVIRDYRADGRLPAPTQKLAGVVAEGMVQARLAALDAYVKADDGPHDQLPGKGMVQLRSSGGGMGVPSVCTARYEGSRMEETQNLFMLSESSPMALSSRLTNVGENKVEYLEVNGLPGHDLITARAYVLDRQDPCASTVQELTLDVRPTIAAGGTAGLLKDAEGKAVFDMNGNGRVDEGDSHVLTQNSIEGCTGRVMTDYDTLKSLVGGRASSREVAERMGYPVTDLVPHHSLGRDHTSTVFDFGTEPPSAQFYFTRK